MASQIHVSSVIHMYIRSLASLLFCLPLSSIAHLSPSLAPLSPSRSPPSLCDYNSDSI